MSFNIALSGLNVALSELSVTGNNIANSSTHGFKESRAEFADVYAVGYQGISENAIGNGVRLANVAQQHSQGNLQFTSSNLDLAVSGQGFFVLGDGGEQVYTRAGAFGVDQDGFIVNSGNQRLQVFPYDTVADRFDTAQLTDLQLESGLGQPSATNDVDVGINLMAAPSTVFEPDPASVDYEAFDRTDPTTYHYSTSVTVYDSVGAPHIATMYYRKMDDLDDATNTPKTFPSDLGGGADPAGPAGTMLPPTIAAGDNIPPNTWECRMYIQDSNGTWQQVQGESPMDAAGPPAVYRPDILTFDTAGQLEQINGETVNPIGVNPAQRQPQIDYGTITQFDPANGAASMGNLNVDQLSSDDDTDRLVFDYSGTTQFNADFSVQEMSQDGYSAGRLAGIDVDDTGTVYARYSNGQARNLGRVALANFTNPQGLRQLGDTNWSESFTSGQALYGEAGTSNFGVVQSGALESSNVEITEQLVKMITAQRNFQANSQMLSTEDQVTQTMLNIR